LLAECLAHVQQPTAVPLPASLARLTTSRRWILNSPRHRVIALIGAVGVTLLGIVLWHASEAPDIAGKWTGEEWGEVALEMKQPGEYEGTYTDKFKDGPGTIQVKWSRLERRFNGTWGDGKDGHGKISLRLVDGAIRGAWTTSKDSDINPGTPELADLLWKRRSDKTDAPARRRPTQPVAASTPPAKPQPQTRRVHRFGALTTGHDVRIACSADGRRIAIANGNPTLIMLGGRKSIPKDNWKPSVDILDAETGTIVLSLDLTTIDEDTVLDATEGISHIEATALAFAPDGSVVAVGTSIGQVKLFDARSGELVRTLDDETAKFADKVAPENWKSLKRAMGSVASLAFSPDGSLLAMCGGSFADFSERFGGVERTGLRVTGPGRLKVWEVPTGKLKHDLEGHNDHAYAVAFSPDGQLLASAGRWANQGDLFGNGVIVWNPHTGKGIHSLIRTTADGGIRSISFSPDSKRLAIGTQRFDGDSSTGGVSLVRASSGVEEWLVTVPGYAKPVAFSPDGTTVAVLCGGRSIWFLDVATGTMNHEIRPGEPEEVRWRDLAVAPLSQMLAIGGVDKERRGSVEVWSTRVSENANLPAAASPATAAAPPPDTLKAESNAVRNFKIAAQIRTITASADGRLVAVASGNPALNLHGDATSGVVEDWKPMAEVLDAVTGKTVVRLELTTHDEAAMLAESGRARSFEVETLAFSPDGAMVAVGTNVGQVKLFHARTGELALSLDDQKAKLADKKTPEKFKSLTRAMGRVASLAFSPDGSLLAMCGDSFDDVPLVIDRNEPERQRTTGPGRLKVWNVKSRTLEHDLVGHSYANAVAFSLDGHWLASAGSWSAPEHGIGVILWNPQTGTKRRTVLTEAGGSAHSVAFSPDSKLIAINSLHVDIDRTQTASAISLAHVESGVIEWRRTSPGSVKPMAFYGGSVVALRGGQSLWFLQKETGLTQSILNRSADPQDGGRWNDFVIAKQGHMWVIGGEDAEGKGSITVMDPDRPATATEPAP
jgi:WD40 repeat protein